MIWAVSALVVLAEGIAADFHPGNNYRQYDVANEKQSIEALAASPLLAVAVLAIGGAVAGGLAVVQASEGRTNLQNQLNTAKSDLALLKASNDAITPQIQKACSASTAASNVDTAPITALIAKTATAEEKAALTAVKETLDALVAADVKHRC